MLLASIKGKALLSRFALSRISAETLAGEMDERGRQEKCFPRCSFFSVSYVWMLLSSA